MTTFQLVATAVFLGVVAISYGREVKQFLADILRSVRPTPQDKEPTQDAADLVADMVTVAELRDRLADLQCADGVDACTVLLRVMVEFKPDRGEV